MIVETMSPTELITYAVIIMCFSVGVFFGLIRIAPKLLGNQFPEREAREEREKVLAERIEELERKNKYQEEELSRKIKDLELTVKVLTKQGEDSFEKIAQMRLRISELERQLGELKSHERQNAGVAVHPAKNKTRRVLGVWPTAPKLDQLSEKDAIFSSGFEYEALEGANATRMGLVLELDRKNYDIMEIGAPGGAGGIMLSDGMTPPGWWLQLAKQHNIEIFVVLANESSSPGTINVADALYNAGAKAVISVDSSIDDSDAVKFARILYGRLSQNVPLAKAVDFSKLVITDSGSEAIRLRERN
jgi:hypothetical protein